MLLYLGIVYALVYGWDIGRLGIWHDDWAHVVLPHVSSRGSIIRYVVADPFGHLLSSRPLLYPALMVERIALLGGLRAAHSIPILFHFGSCWMLYLLTRRLVPHLEFLPFVAAIVFATYPIAPIMPLWISPVHHVLANLCTLLSMYLACAERPSVTSRSSLGWSVAAYGCALLCTEAFVLHVPAFVAGRSLLAGASETWSQRIGRCGRRLAPYILMLATWVVFRHVVTSFGTKAYEAHLGFDLIGARKLLVGLAVVHFPFPSVVSRVFPRLTIHTFPYRMCVLSAVTVIVGNRCLYRDILAAERYPLGELVVLGVVLASAGMFPIAISFYPVYQLTGITSRVNFPCLIGVAISFAALMTAGLIGFAQVPRHASVARLVVLGAACIGIGVLIHTWYLFWHSPVELPAAAQREAEFVGAFTRGGARYERDLYLQSLGPVLVAAGAGFLVAVNGLKGRFAVQNLQSSAGALFSVLMGGVVLLSGLAHDHEQKRLGESWQRHQAFVRDVYRTVPTAGPRTFLLFDDVTDNRLVLWSFYDVNTFLWVLYGSPSVMGSFVDQGQMSEDSFTPWYYEDKQASWPSPEAWRSAPLMNPLGRGTLVGPQHKPLVLHIEESAGHTNPQQSNESNPTPISPFSEATRSKDTYELLYH